MFLERVLFCCILIIVSSLEFTVVVMGGNLRLTIAL